MTREQTIQLLQFLKGTYPYCKIEDPRGMVEAWMLAFCDDDAHEVYKAARLHMSKKKFFPSPAEIKENMTRARLLYDIPEPKRIASETAKQLPSGQEEEMSVEDLWEWIVEDHKKGLYKVEQKGII